MRRAGAGARGRWRAQGPRSARRPLRPGAAQRAARRKPLASLLHLASTVSSSAGRFLGAFGDERCFDAAEPRLGPPSNDHGPWCPEHSHATPRSSGDPLDTRWEPRWARATRHGRCRHENRAYDYLTKPTPGVRLEADRRAGAGLGPVPDEPGLQQKHAVLGREMLLRGPGCLDRVAARPEALHGVRLDVRREALLPGPLLRGPRQL